MKRQSDINIYVKGCSVDALVQWLDGVIGKLERLPDTGELVIYTGKIGPVIFTEMNDSSLEIWFNTSKTPWASDVDCGRQAVRELNCIVICEPSQQYFPEVHPLSETFLQIDEDGERSIVIDDM